LFICVEAAAVDWTFPTTVKEAAQAIHRKLMIFQGTTHAYNPQVPRALPSGWENDDYFGKFTKPTMETLLIMWNQLKAELLANKYGYNFGPSLIDPFADGKAWTLPTLSDHIVQLLIDYDEVDHGLWCENNGRYPNAADNYQRASSKFLKSISDGATIRNSMQAAGMMSPTYLHNMLQNMEPAKPEKGELARLPACLPACLPVYAFVF
jgi:hypothetical protein